MLDTIVQSGSGVSSESRVLKNTYTLLSATLIFTAAITWFTQDIHLSRWAYLGSVLGGFALLFVTMGLRNSALGLLALFGFAGLQGLSLGQIINVYMRTSGGATAVTEACGMTALTFVCLSAYVHLTRKDFSAWGGMLFAGLIVVVVGSLIGFFVPSQAYQLTLAGISALIFCGYILYDTSAILLGGETNYIMATMRLYLDILNLFLSLLRLLSPRN